MRSVRVVVPIACVLAMVAGCSKPSSGGNTTGHVSVSPSPGVRTTNVPIDSLPGSQTQAWRDLDVTLIPPTGFAQDIHLTAEVVNHTGGKVDDATARRWATDYLRAGVWEKWGTENIQLDGFFNHLAPADSITQGGVFGDNYAVMNKAKADGKRVQIQNLAITRFTVIAVSADVRAALVNTYSYPGPAPDFALVVDQQGPAGAWTVTATGTREPYQTAAATFRSRTFVAGDERDFPETLGMIWYVHTYLGCDNNAFLRAACGA